MRYSRYFWWALGLGLLLALPSLWVGMQLDDYFHWGLVTQRSTVLETDSPVSPYGLFSFLDGDPSRVFDLMNLGLVPWWTNPQVEYEFWRPLTEITHGLDYSLWPNTPALMHMQSLIYFGFMLWAGFRLFKLFHADSNAWLWASFLFAVSYTHGVPVGWLANRNSVIAVLFVILALSAHHQWREQDQPGMRLRASLLLIMGLLAGEMAVTAGAYLLAYAVFYDSGDWRSRFLSLLPYAVIGVIWISLRSLLGYGASGSGHYLDPLISPGLFLQMLWERLLNLVGGLFLVVPPELGSGLPPYRIWSYLGLFLLVVWVAWPLLRAERRARFWLAGALLCLIPVSSTVSHSRLLIAASVGAAGFLGMLFSAWSAGMLRRGGPGKSITALVVVLMMVLNIGLSAILLPAEIIFMRFVGDHYLNNGASAWDLSDLPPDVTPILINPPLSSAGGYINGIRLYKDLPVTAKTWLLASGTRPLKLTVVNRNTFDIESSDGIYDGEQEGVLRGPQAPFSVGDSVQLDGMVATVLAVDQGVPTLTRFQFERPLNSRSYRFAHWSGGEISACKLPEVNESIVLEMNSEQCALP